MNLENRIAPTKLDAEFVVRSELLKLLPDDQRGDIDNIPLAELGVDSLDLFEKLLLLDEEQIGAQYQVCVVPGDQVGMIA